MLRLYIKKQLRWNMLCAVVICMALCIWNYFQRTSEAVYTFDFLKLNLTEGTEEELLEELDVLQEEILTRYMSVESFTAYQGEIPYAETEEGDGSALLLNRQMIEWRNRELYAQAVYTDSLYDDILLMWRVSEMTEYQLKLRSVMEQNQAMYARNIKRYEDQPYRRMMYQKLYTWAEGIEIDFEIQNLSGISEFADYISADYTGLILILFSCFFGMEEFVHGNEGRQVLVSERNVRCYAWKMMLVNLLIALLEALLFTGMVYLIWGRFVFRADILQLPVQALTDYDNVVFPVSVGGYLLICLGSFCLVYAALGALLQVVSLLSPNSTVSFSVSLVLTFAVGKFLLSDMMAMLTTDRPFLRVRDYPLDNYFVLTGGCVLVILLSFILVGALTKLRIRHWNAR